MKKVEGRWPFTHETHDSPAYTMLRSPRCESMFRATDHTNALLFLRILKFQVKKSQVFFCVRSTQQFIDSKAIRKLPTIYTKNRFDGCLWWMERKVKWKDGSLLNENNLSNNFYLEVVCPTLNALNQVWVWIIQCIEEFNKSNVLKFNLNRLSLTMM